jgi:hypothetical protein
MLDRLKITEHLGLIMNQASQTIVNSLSFSECKMPDGSVQLRPVHQAKTSSGEVVWEFVDEKIEAFDRRFAETNSFRPGNLDPATTEVLTKNNNDPTSLREMNPTRKHLSEELLMALGDPDRIIAQKGLDPEKLEQLQRDKLASSLLHARCVLVGGKWSQVIQYVPNFHPMRR